MPKKIVNVEKGKKGFRRRFSLLSSKRIAADLLFKVGGGDGVGSVCVLHGKGGLLHVKGSGGGRYFEEQKKGKKVTQ